MGDRVMQFEDLEAWQLARNQVKAVYAFFSDPHAQKDFGLKDQLTRSAVSVMSNLAEGFERQSLKEKSHFYTVARASNGEVRSLLYVVADIYPALLDLATQQRQQTIKIGRLITGIIKTTQARLIT
jgi:four helix bundle protein